MRWRMRAWGVRILVTGFEPFGGDAENASGEAVAALAAGWSDSSIEVVTGVLPVEFVRAPAVLAALAARHRPDAVIAVGEAGGRAAVTPERTARNCIDARIPDNAGAQPRDARVADGPDERPSRVDVDAMVDAVRAQGIPAEASCDAGAFVCNQIAYVVAGLDVPGGFVHVPAVRSAGAAGVGAETDAAGGVRSSLTITQLADALAACVRVAAAGVSGAAGEGNGT